MRRVAFALLSLGVLSACREERPSALPEARSVPAANAFCVEHGVAEAVCTQCNPKLVPIFRANGDWCDEHGFPESFCPICHPERGGLPEADLTADAAPPDGTKVLLRTPEAVRAAGIEVVPASVPATNEVLDVLATITYDALRRAEVNARASGIVLELLVEPGAQVEKGDPLVRLESAWVGAEQSRLVAARSRLAVAEAAHARATSLLDNGMASNKDLQAAQLELDTARAEVSAATAALGMIGIEEGAENRYTLLAPIPGTLVHVAAAVGRLVDAEEILCQIVDTSSMWAELEVPEAELVRVAVGQTATIRVDALGEGELAGTIDYLAPELDPRTRTVRARVRLANPDGSLRANLFARARIDLGASRARSLVPDGALQRAGNAELVFVQLAADRYEARRVRSGARRGDLVEILSGVEPGELVAVHGSFLLKTETLKGSIGAGCCEVE